MFMTQFIQKAECKGCRVDFQRQSYNIHIFQKMWIKETEMSTIYFFKCKDQQFLSGSLDSYLKGFLRVFVLKLLLSHKNLYHGFHVKTLRLPDRDQPKNPSGEWLAHCFFKCVV